MIKSPAKTLARPFLKYLTENRFISKAGREYSEPEVLDLLVEKESKLALKDYARQIKQRENIDHVSVITSFQERMFQGFNTGIIKGQPEKLSTHSASSQNSVETNLFLPEVPTWVFMPSQLDEQHSGECAPVIEPIKPLAVAQTPRRSKGEKLDRQTLILASKYKVVGVRELSLKQIKKELKDTQSTIAQVEALSSKFSFSTGRALSKRQLEKEIRENKTIQAEIETLALQLETDSGL